MDHSLNGEGENIHDVDSFNDAINELNQEELGAIRFHDGAYVDANRTIQVKFMRNKLAYLAHYADHYACWADEK